MVSANMKINRSKSVISKSSVSIKPVADTAVQRIVTEILLGLRRGRYRPGERLVVADLAKQLGVSAVPVREALHILSGQEIVELRAQRGARIRELSPKEILDTLRVWPVIAQLNFELAADQLSVPKVTTRFASEIAALRDIQRAIDEAYQRRVSLDLFAGIQNLYEVCAAINQNAYFSTLRGPLHVELYYRQVADILPGALWDSYVKNILATIDAILEGDKARTTKIFSRHHMMVLVYLTKEFASRERAA
jgi:DNA-binding GntR family transcriptional regulator